MNLGDFFAVEIQFFKDHPFVLLVAVLLPLYCLAAARRTYPHVPLVLLLLVPCLLSFGLLLSDEIFWLVAGVDIAVVIVALVDLGTIPGRRAFAVERHTGRIVSLQQDHAARITITNRSRRVQTVWVRDDLPEEITTSPSEFSVRLPGRQRTTREFALRATQRGAFTLRHVNLRARSSLGLWQVFLEYPVASEIHVYPDMKQLSDYAVMARTDRLSLLGVRRTRKVGQDNEFERLRDFTVDDNYKHIDWRSTARRNKLTVKDFQTNQSQRLIFLLDCGRMMTNESSDISLLDHALNSMLMLSYVALRQGDAVGLICFSDDIHSYVPPNGGMAQMNRLLHSSFARFPRLVESRYDQAFVYLRSHCSKRSLVILISNLIDEVNAHQVQTYLSTLVGRHLPLGVLIRDHSLFDAAENTARDEEEVYRAAAAAEILAWRHHVLMDLERKGVLALDVFPEDMTAPLVNRYLEIKARHLL